VTSPAKAIAASVGMTAFVVACLSGMLADNPANVVLRHALASMFVLYVVGAVLGSIGMHVVTRHVEDYKYNNPISNHGHHSSGHAHSRPGHPHAQNPPPPSSKPS